MSIMVPQPEDGGRRRASINALGELLSRWPGADQEATQPATIPAFIPEPPQVWAGPDLLVTAGRSSREERRRSRRRHFNWTFREKNSEEMNE